VSDENGYCIHGKYVGGIMTDWICGLCEEGRTELIELPKWDVFVTPLGECGDGVEVKLKTVYNEESVESTRRVLGELVEAGAEMEWRIEKGTYAEWVTPEYKEEMEKGEGRDEGS